MLFAQPCFVVCCTPSPPGTASGRAGASRSQLRGSKSPRLSPGAPSPQQRRSRVAKSRVAALLLQLHDSDDDTPGSENNKRRGKGKGRKAAAVTLSQLNPRGDLQRAAAQADTVGALFLPEEGCCYLPCLLQPPVQLYLQTSEAQVSCLFS